MKNPEPRKKELFTSEPNFSISEVISFPKPNDAPLISFNEVLELRHSNRDFKSIDINTLGTLLYLSARSKKIVVSKNKIIERRPYASAGAKYPIDLIISAPEIFGENKLGRYNPEDHSIELLNIKDRDCMSLRLHISESFPSLKSSVVIWFIVFRDKVESKYENSDSLIWRDVGVLSNTMHLTSIYLGTSSCLTGTLSYPFISNIFKPQSVLSGGAIIIG